MSKVVIREALTFDDVLLEPARSEVLPAEVDVRTRLTREIELGIPLISAAMDTVTEANLAIAMAQHGGLGVIHRNLDVAAQASEVQKVKKFEAGIVVNPITLGPEATLADALDLMAAQGISGIPVVEGPTRRLVGILTNRDVRFATDLSVPVRELMTADRLVTVPEGVGREEAKQLLHKHRIEKLLVVDDDFRLIGLMTVKDIEKAQLFPHACKDAHGRLRVGAAVGTGAAGLARAEALIEAGIDVLVIDTAHGHSAGVLEFGRARAARQQCGAGDRRQCRDRGRRPRTDRSRGGRDQGRHRPWLDLHHPRDRRRRRAAAHGAARDHRALPRGRRAGDRGRRHPHFGRSGQGDRGRRDCAMIGSLFAGTDESPGEVYLYQGRSYKAYRGMGSLGAMARGSADRYFQEEVRETLKLVPEGIEGQVPYRGPMAQIVHQLVGGLRAAMGYTGNATIAAMQRRCTFLRVTQAGVRESHVHDVAITREAPNYRREF